MDIRQLYYTCQQLYIVPFMAISTTQHLFLYLAPKVNNNLPEQLKHIKLV